MSHGLAPSKSTVYVSNLPFSLTNNDLHQVFEKCGKVVKVTILTNKETRENRGVAFILFIDQQTAMKAVAMFNGKELMGRTLKASIAKDNGRTTEFIRRKTYKDKSQCYQCGEFGHLSYKCPRNMLGEREQPKKKERKRKGKGDEDEEGRAAAAAGDDYDEEEEEEVDDDFSLHRAIVHCQMVREFEEDMQGGGGGGGGAATSRALVADTADAPPAKRSKPAEEESSYFSDED